MRTQHVCVSVCALLQVCAHKQQLADELSQLTGKHKQLQADKEAADTELSTLKPAHDELQQMHSKATAELQSTKTALQKSQEARVHAEVGAELDLVRLLLPPHTVLEAHTSLQSQDPSHRADRQPP